MRASVFRLLVVGMLMIGMSVLGLDSAHARHSAQSDVDGDSVPNTTDNCPTVANPTQSDLDNDGLGTACDDANNDGVDDTPPPTAATQCKQNGWRQFNNPSFKNQGDCVSYVETGGRNQSSG